MKGRAIRAAVIGDELGRPVSPVAAPQPHVVAGLQCDYAKAIVLQLVDPAVADRHLRREHRLTRSDEAGRLAPVAGERRTHQHRAPVTYAIPRVDSLAREAMQSTRQLPNAILRKQSSLTLFLNNEHSGR